MICRAFCLLLFLCAAGAAAAQDIRRNYTYLYFENGYPTRFQSRRPEDQANFAARENPDLVIQTGYYSLRFDCDDVQLSGYDALTGTDYVTALNEDVAQFSPAKLLLKIHKDGTVYTCTSGMFQDEKDARVRLIESGRYVQRFDHTGLVFTPRRGEPLEKAGRFEVTAWPDHVVFTLDLSGVSGVDRVEIQLTSPAGKTHRSSVKGDCARLALSPHLDSEYDELDPSAISGPELACRFNPDEYGLQFDLWMDKIAFPADTNRLDEFVIEVRNRSGRPADVPLIFNEVEARALTGTSMLLCEEDGRPTGIPVQVSKNWHNEKGNRVVHDGPWLRGYAVVPLAANETKRFRLKVVTGFWGGVPAVSFAQLSVIGYGGNWKWDESALGCWGESMCYDPTLHLGSSFITDVRPSFTPGLNGGSHEWTENSGGGDFLIYVDRYQRFRRAKKLKTAYHWTGPNMTEVLYSGVTDDDKIRFNYRIRSVRTADVHRRFHAYKVEFLEDVTSPERLVFHQMAADYYNSANFERFYCGNEDGLRSSHVSNPFGKGTAESPIPFEDSWLAIDDTEASSRGMVPAKAGRNILSLSSTLKGRSFPLYLHQYSPKGRKTLFDLSADSIGRSYKRRDVVEGELEFIMPPNKPENYWGTDREFAGRLKTYGTNVWQAAADEYRHNVELRFLMHQGRLLNRYPLEILSSADSGAVLADFTVKRGGIGHLPIILRDVPAGSALRAERFLDGRWVPVGPEGAYQGNLAVNGTLDCVFNISRPTPDLSESWRIRILKLED